MNLPITAIVLQTDLSWAFYWTNTAATYYRAILNGQEIGVASGSPYYFTLPGYKAFPPPLEIVEESNLALSEIYPANLAIQWYQVSPKVDHYEVDLWTGSAWQLFKTVNESGLPVYTVQPQNLKDETTNQYQVVAADAIGNSSTGLPFETYIVTPPILDESHIRYAYTPSTTTVQVQYH